MLAMMMNGIYFDNYVGMYLFCRITLGKYKVTDKNSAQVSGIIPIAIFFVC